MIQQRRTTGTPTPLPPPDMSMVYEAVAEAVASAEAYARTASDFAAIHDARGLSYSLRCAAACIASAADMLSEVRPSQQGGRAA